MSSTATKELGYHSLYYSSPSPDDCFSCIQNWYIDPFRSGNCWNHSGHDDFWLIEDLFYWQSLRIWSSELIEKPHRFIWNIVLINWRHLLNRNNYFSRDFSRCCFPSLFYAIYVSCTPRLNETLCVQRRISLRTLTPSSQKMTTVTADTTSISVSSSCWSWKSWSKNPCLRR